MVSDDSNNDILLEVAGLKKYFPIRKGILRKLAGQVRAVDGVDFYIKKGETLSLVGESGCGKTTTSRCILRALDPTAGQIFFREDGDEFVDVAALPESKVQRLRSEMQMIFQDPFSSLNPRMTLLDIVGEPLLVHGMTNHQQRMERVAELLRLVGLRPEYMRRYPHAFSGGQRQRIGIARALALNPRLIVADEPVSALDVSVQAQILNLLLELQEQLRLTYLFVAHDLSVVKHISERVAVMYAGRIVEQTDVHTLFEEPLHPYTKGLIASIPVLGIVRDRLDVIKGTVPNLINLPAGCKFAPRCDARIEHGLTQCTEKEPELIDVRPDHTVRCWLFG